MADILWLIRRLKAMSFLEIQWRLSQNLIQKKEKTYFEKKDIAVTSYVFNSQLSDAQLNSEKLHINFKNREYSLNTSIHLLAGALYDDYKKIWNAGFQTDHIWPDTFSYKLEYKQRDDIGDARTNWELNRHFQFALLAKDYAVSGDVKYLFEFKELFQDWTDKNPFLHGISWTSVMETAIRCSNWCYAYAFLEHGGAVDELLEKLRIGIINMTDYIANHYSRYSSANNHLIIEAYAIGQSGILFNRKEWTDTAIRLLTEELPKQNYTDGVNKELSLHYQSFYIEAMGLMMRLMIKNEIDVPASWEPMLQKMSQYLADCMGEYGETVAFGDDDEGKILDLQGGDINYYSYVLSLMSLLLHKKYVENSDFETLKWLFTKGEIQETEKIKKYESPQYCCYKEGGNTILRSRDRKVLIGIDHAALGFGSIAAHGHADALSFQLFYEGRPVFIDPGTYIYHCDLKSRNEFRRTDHHNTVCICEKNQSEMLGAFLWGRKAISKLLNYEEENGTVKLVIQHDGYKPIIHTRRIEFDGDRQLVIIDELSRNAPAKAILLLSPQIDCKIADTEAVLSNGTRLFVSSDMKESCSECSEQYGMKENTKTIEIPFCKKLEIQIII